MPNASAHNIRAACDTLMTLLDPRDTSGLVCALRTNTSRLPDDERLSHDNYRDEKAGQAVVAAMMLAETFLTDVHRIADALEELVGYERWNVMRGSALDAPN